MDRKEDFPEYSTAWRNIEGFKLVRLTCKVMQPHPPENEN
jgi:hypothetical protein